jgi:hypothetical protein
MATAQRREASFTAPARGGTLGKREAMDTVTNLMVATLAATQTRMRENPSPAQCWGA